MVGLNTQPACTSRDESEARSLCHYPCRRTPSCPQILPSHLQLLCPNAPWGALFSHSVMSDSL